MDFPKYRISNGKGLLEIGSFDALFDKLSNVLLSSDVDNKLIWKTNSNGDYLFKSICGFYHLLECPFDSF
jgi:hypothetical protein